MSEFAKAYAGALFALCDETDAVQQVREELLALQTAFAENPAFARLLSSPVLCADERRGVVRESFAGKLHAYTVNFLQLLADKRAANQLPDCAREFKRLSLQKDGVEEARVVSAVALTEAQQQELAARLGAWAGKRVQLFCEVDPALLGGVCVELAGKRLDGSVLRRLEGIRKTLAERMA